MADKPKRPANASGSNGSSGPRRATPAQSSNSSNPHRAVGAGSAAASSQGGDAGSKPTKRRRKRVWAVIRALLIALLAVMLVVTVSAYVFYQRAELPEPNADFETQTSRIYFNDGTTELGTLAVQNRTAIEYDQMPQSIKDAVVAAEDRTFWTNQGVDVMGMTRALWRIARGQDLQGGSTITQQYIKILYLTSDQTVTRKLNELALAVKMNKDESKEDVLQGYLNTIYFGRNSYGIQAAAEAYFQTDAQNLTLAQSAALAAMVNSPSNYDPATGPEVQQALLERYQYVLDGMLDPMQTITQAEHDEVYNQLPEFPPYEIDNIYGGPNGFLIQMATDELRAAGMSDTEINGGGLTIITTFDPRLQQAAIDAAQSTVAEAVETASPILNEAGEYVQPDPAGLHVGLASVEVGTGAVLALYGGPDFVNNYQNWATTRRYAASTFKVWGAVAGLRNGFGLQSPLRGSTYTPVGDSVPVQNDSGAQYGTVTLQTAIRDSINTSFVDLIGQIPDGTEELIRAANDAGVPEDESWAPQLNRMVLGEGEVSALDNVTGYATLANNGVRNETHVVAEVRGANGEVIHTGNTTGTQAIEEAVARDLTHALSGAVAGSTINAVGGRAVAGKTGTEGIAVGQEGSTQQITRAGWLVGYTKQIATAVVMVAGDDGNQNLDVYAQPWMGAFYGAGYPTDVWDAYMAVAVDGMEYLPFDPPANIQPTVRSTLPPPTSGQPESSPAEETEPATSAPETTAPPATQIQVETEPPAPATSEPMAPTTQPPVTTAPPEPTWTGGQPTNEGAGAPG